MEGESHRNYGSSSSGSGCSEHSSRSSDSYGDSESSADYVSRSESMHSGARSSHSSNQLEAPKWDGSNDHDVSDLHSQGLWIVAEASTESPTSERIVDVPVVSHTHVIAEAVPFSRSTSSTSSHTHSCASTSEREVQPQSLVTSATTVPDATLADKVRVTSGSQPPISASASPRGSDFRAVMPAQMVAPATHMIPHAVVPSGASRMVVTSIPSAAKVLQPVGDSSPPLMATYTSHTSHMVAPTPTALGGTIPGYPILQKTTEFSAPQPPRTVPLPPYTEPVTSVQPQQENTTPMITSALQQLVADRRGSAYADSYAAGRTIAKPHHITTGNQTSQTQSAVTAEMPRTVVETRQTGVNPSNVVYKNYSAVPTAYQTTYDNAGNARGQGHPVVMHAEMVYGGYPRPMVSSPLSDLPGVTKGAVRLQEYRTARQPSSASSTLSGRNFSDVSSSWSRQGKWLPVTRYGPTGFPDHVLASHPAFPHRQLISPFTLYYFDATAPNQVLLDHDLSSGRNVGKQIRNMVRCDHLGETADVSDAVLLDDHSSQLSARSSMVSTSEKIPSAMDPRNVGAIPSSVISSRMESSIQATKPIPQKRTAFNCCGGASPQEDLHERATASFASDSGSSMMFSDERHDDGASWAGSTESTESSLPPITASAKPSMVGAQKAKARRGCCGGRVDDEPISQEMSHDLTPSELEHSLMDTVRDGTSLRSHRHSHRRDISGSMAHQETHLAPTVTGTRASGGGWDITEARDPRGKNLLHAPIHEAVKQDSAEPGIMSHRTLASHQNFTSAGSEYTDLTDAVGCCGARRRPRAARQSIASHMGAPRALRHSFGSKAPSAARSMSRVSRRSRGTSVRSGRCSTRGSVGRRQSTVASSRSVSRSMSRSVQPQKKQGGACCGRYSSGQGDRSRSTSLQKRASAARSSARSYRDGRSVHSMRRSSRMSEMQHEGIVPDSSRMLGTHRTSRTTWSRPGRSMSRMSNTGCCGTIRRPERSNSRTRRATVDLQSERGSARPGVETRRDSRMTASTAPLRSHYASVSVKPSHQVSSRSYSYATLGDHSVVASRRGCCGIGGVKGTTAGKKMGTESVVSRLTSATTRTRMSNPDQHTRRSHYYGPQKGARKTSDYPFYGQQKGTRISDYYSAQPEVTKRSDYQTGSLVSDEEEVVHQTGRSRPMACVRQKDPPTTYEVRKFFFNAQQSKKVDDGSAANVMQYSTSYRNYPDVCYDMMVPTNKPVRRSPGRVLNAPSFCG